MKPVELNIQKESFRT